jgi:hypothetical protein
MGAPAKALREIDADAFQRLKHSAEVSVQKWRRYAKAAVPMAA